MSRVFNFSAGPAALPLEVLEKIRNDIPDWQGTGMSVMEVSHRGKHFVELAARSEANIRELLDIPADYSVLFPQGGATLQMAMVPLNLTGPDDTVDYVVTGSWGKKAAGEATKFCKVNVAADASDKKAGSEAPRPRTCITPRMKPSPVSSFISFLAVMCRWWRICRVRFFRGRSM